MGLARGEDAEHDADDRQDGELPLQQEEDLEDRLDDVGEAQRDDGDAVTHDGVEREGSAHDGPLTLARSGRAGG